MGNAEFVRKTAEKGDADILKQCIETGCNLNSRNREGCTALMLSTRAGHLNAVKILLENKAKPNIQDRKGITALHYACKSSKQPEIVSLLIENKANVNLLDKESNSAISLASQKGWVDIVEKLYHANAEINNFKKNHKLPLISAMLAYQQPTVKKLLELKADPSLKDEKGQTVLHHGVLWGMKDMCNLLLDSNVSIDIENSSGYTPLMIAAKHKQIDIVENLFSRKANVNASASSDGCSPLLMATTDLDVCTSLLRAKANVNNQDKEGNTPLYKAVTQGHLDIVEALIEAKADVNLQNGEGWTPLMIASRLGYKDVITCLLEYNASVEITNKSNETAEKIAHQRKRSDVATLIKSFKRKLDLNQCMQQVQAARKEETAQQITDRIIDGLYSALGVDRVSLFIMDWKKNEMICKESRDIKGLRLPIGGITGMVAKTGKMINIREAYEDSRFNDKVDKEQNYRTKNILSVPIKDINEQVLGVLVLINKFCVQCNAVPCFAHDVQFNNEDMEFVEHLVFELVFTLNPETSPSKTIKSPTKELPSYNPFKRPPSTKPYQISTESTSKYAVIPSLDSIENLEQIGQGFYGITYKGKYKGEDVVAKIPKRKAGAVEWNEMSTHSIIPPHLNVVKFIGFVCNPVAFVTEYMAGGNLLDTIRKEEKRKKILKPQNIQTALLEIAAAIVHLHQNAIIHRDIALRNVLLDVNDRCLLSDFGLAKHIKQSSSYTQIKTSSNTSDSGGSSSSDSNNSENLEIPLESFDGDEEIADRYTQIQFQLKKNPDNKLYSYQSTHGEPLPLAWLAPESLDNGIFSVKTDVWMYGVTSWELVSGGKKPYSNIESHKIGPLICSQEIKLDWPDNTPPLLVNILNKCFEYNPSDRPTMEEILLELSKINL